MKVQELMATEVLTVAPDDEVDRVFFLIHFEKVRHLPVVERGKVVGIVSDRDLHKALGPRGKRRSVQGSKATLSIIPRKVRHIMRRGVITVSPRTEAAEAAALMAKRKIGALPVVQKDKLVGIITATDLLAAFVKLSARLEASEGSGPGRRHGPA